MSLYLDHFGLREPPFRITPATDMFFSGAGRGGILAGLLYAIEVGEGLVKVTGEVGSGKTMLSRMLVEQLPETTDTIYIATPSLSRDEVFHTLAEELGLAGDAERPGQLLRSLQNALIARYRQGRRVVVIIDEAHAMPPESLEGIRLLSNLEAGRDKLMQIVLFGQPELDEILASRPLQPLRERITHSFALPPLDGKSVAAYLEFRLHAAGHDGPRLFREAAATNVARISRGLTRRINILADKALLSAFADGRQQVEGKDVERAAADSGYAKPWPRVPGSGWFFLPMAAAMITWLGYALWPTGAASAQPAAPAPAPGPAQPYATAIPGPAKPESTPALPRPIDERHVYTLQLSYAATSDALAFARLRNRIAEAMGSEEVFVVPTRIRDEAVYALCLGRFNSRNAAAAKAGTMPQALRQLQPQVRSLAALQGNSGSGQHQ